MFACLFFFHTFLLVSGLTISADPLEAIFSLLCVAMDTIEHPKSDLICCAIQTLPLNCMEVSLSLHSVITTSADVRVLVKATGFTDHVYPIVFTQNDIHMPYSHSRLSVRGEGGGGNWLIMVL